MSKGENMREIKFRGKDLKTKQWVYGGLSAYKKDGNTFIVNTAKDHLGFITFMQEVDPNTVGQFTGLKDKNGKEIYEGDIVYPYGFEEDKYKYIIFWHDGKKDIRYQDGDFVGWAIRSIYEATDEFSLQERQCRQYYEVVGNIHD